MSKLQPTNLAAVLALLFLQPALAQPPREAAAAEPAALSERIEIELVSVDVWISDADGRPVPGLRAGDFEVLHDGRRVPITHFTEIRSGVAVSDSTDSSTGDSSGGSEIADAEVRTPGGDPAPGHLVLYFDQSRLHPSNYPPLIRSLESFLERDGIAAERVLLLRQDQGLSVAAPFGSSKQELLASLQELAKGRASGMGLQAEERQALEAIRVAWEVSQDAVATAGASIGAIPTTPGSSQGVPGSSSGGSPRSVVGGVGSGAGPDTCGPFVGRVEPILDSYARSSGYRVARSLAHLSNAAGFLAGLPGVKTLLYFSDGLDTRPGAPLAAYATRLCPIASADLLTSNLNEEITSQFLALTRHANANRVTIHALQASGLKSPEAGRASSGRRSRSGSGPGSGTVFESTLRAGEREGLSLIASETGGRAIFNRNDLSPQLAQIGEDLGSYYSLAYDPRALGPAAGGTAHRIEVRLEERPYTVRYRRGYIEKDSARWLDERIEGALNLGITSNPLEVRLGAAEIRKGEGDTFVVPLHVTVPVEKLAFLPQDPPEEALVAEVKVRVLARDIGSNALAIREQSYRLRGSSDATGWARLAIELQLAAGTHITAVGIQDSTSGEASFISTTLQVGAGGGL